MKKIEGSADRTNEAYLIYEQASGIEILSRDTGGSPIIKTNGYYKLNPGFTSVDKNVKLPPSSGQFDLESFG